MSDDEILEGAVLVLNRVGPVGLTLGAVAEAAGLRAPTLIQRFGSKRALLVAVAARRVDEVAPLFDAARRSHRSPWAAMMAALVGMVAGIDAPASMGHHLAFLAMDLTDRDLRRLAAAHAVALTGELEATVTEAIAVGELMGLDAGGRAAKAPEWLPAIPADPATLARVVYTAYNGSLIGWAVDGRGPLGRWITSDIGAALAPYLKASTHA